MAFTPRNFEQILTDMIAHVRANTTLTDFTVGSVIRTILEASALEDDEQYFQMVQLLDAFRVATARDADLDERAADYNMVRLPPKSAYTSALVFRNGGLITDTLVFDVVSGSPTTLTLNDSSDFPTAPFTVRVGEGTPQVEDCSVTSHNPTTGEIVVATLVNDHSVSDRVSVISGGDKVISSGQQPQVPAQGNDSPIVFTSTDTAVIVEGNYESGTVGCSANVAGRTGNVAAGRISQFQGSLPFTGAQVTNKLATEGGRDLETDTDLRARIFRRLSELARGTPNALESGVIGVEDPLTGQRVSTSKLREDYEDPYNHILYIDDGSGFNPSRVNMAQSTLNGLHGIGVVQLNVNDATEFPDAGELLLDAEGANPEHLSYSSKGPGNVLNLDAATSYSHASGVEVFIVDNLGAAEEAQNFFRLTNYPVMANTLELYDNDAGTYQLRAAFTEYIPNRTNGEIQYLGFGLASGTVPLARYGYYTGLVQETQRVVTGVPRDRVNYPGISAGGIMIHVATPNVRRITVTMSITAKNGFDEDAVRDEVQLEIEAFIESLNIGDNVYRAKLIERAMSVSGVENTIIQEPTDDLVVLEDELPIPTDINGSSLITVL